MDKVTLHPLLLSVDRLGAVRAQIAQLRKEEAVLERDVKDSIGKDQVLEGELFRAVLVVQFRRTLLADKVRELLHPNQLRVCENVIEVHSLKITARSTEKVPS